MNAAGLIALTTLECAGWLPASGSGGAPTRSAELHEQLLGIVRSSLRRRQGSDKLRKDLAQALNAASLGVIQEVPIAIEAVRRSGASYLLEFEGWEGTVRERYRFAQMPFISEAARSFEWMARLRRLSREQQVPLAQMLELEFDQRNTAIHLGFALEDGDEPSRVTLESELSLLDRKVDEVLGRLSPEAITLKNAMQKSVNYLDLQRCPQVVEVDLASTREEILAVAGAMDRAGDSVIQPLPFATGPLSAVTKRAAIAWEALTDLRLSLHVIAVWLRALADGGESRTCALCYRHLGRRGKAFCACHQRQSGARQPAREFHIAANYPLQVERLAKTEPGLKQALASANKLGSWAESGTNTLLPSGVNVPEPLVRPAKVLLGSLERFSPATGAELGKLLHELFLRLVRVAAESFSAPGRDSPTEVALARVRQEQARRWLNLRTLFRAWYAQTFNRPSSEEADLLGLAFDIDHPAAEGRPVAPSELVSDLLRQRAWALAEREIDTHAYVNVRRINRLRAQGASLRAIATELGVSHETVRKTLQYSSGAELGSDRRLRTIPAFHGEKLKLSKIGLA